MTDLDTRIRAALNAEDAALLDKFAEPSMPRQIIDSFNGRHRWLVVMVFLMIFVFLGLAVWSAVQFFQVDSLKATIGWAVGFILCMINIGLMKIWYWMELNKNTLTREMKRMELQLARLVGQRPA